MKTDREKHSALVYYWMRAFWALDDMHWIFRPFKRFGNMLKNYGLDEGILGIRGIDGEIIQVYGAVDQYD